MDIIFDEKNKDYLEENFSEIMKKFTPALIENGIKGNLYKEDKEVFRQTFGIYYKTFVKSTPSPSLSVEESSVEVSPMAKGGAGGPDL